MPVNGRYTPRPPMKRSLVRDAQKPRQSGRPTEVPDDFLVRHGSDLRRTGVSVKRYYAELLLDSPESLAFERSMSRDARSRTPGEETWLQSCGQRIKWAREVAGFNQEQLGEMLNIGQQGVSSYEKGKRTPDPFVMLQFCARLRTTLDYVYRGKLEGSHPGLISLLLAAHPELIPQPNGKEPGKDKIQDEYREAIKRNQA